MAFARNVPGLGSVMSTESNQSSENRHLGASQEGERQHTGLYRWNDSENLIPPWSVPPGLIVPGPRQPEAGTPSSVPGPEPDVAAPSADADSWPGAAPPAGWFLRAPQAPPAAQSESIPAQPKSVPAHDTDGDLPGEWFAPPAPASPHPPASPRRPPPALARRQSSAPRQPSARARQPSARRQPLADRQLLAELQPGALAHPRAGRLLVLSADAETSASCPRPDPGAVWPCGRPGLPAHPF